MGLGIIRVCVLVSGEEVGDALIWGHDAGAGVC